MLVHISRFIKESLRKRGSNEGVLLCVLFSSRLTVSLTFERVTWLNT